MSRARASVTAETLVPPVVWSILYTAPMSSDEAPAKRLHTIITASIVVVTLAAVALAFALGGRVSAGVVAIIGLTTLQGLWRGAAEIVAILIAMVLGTILARPLGHALEGPIHSMSGTGGIANRVLAIVVAAALVTGIFSLIASRLTRAFLRSRPNLRAANRYLGAGLGLVEGIFLSLLLMWTVLTLAPVARAQAVAQGSEPTSPVTQTLSRLDDAVRASAFSGLAQSTNPMPDSELMQLATDFTEVMGHEEARRHLLESEPLKQIQGLPSVQAAIERVRADPELVALTGDKAISGEDLSRFLNSPTVLDILDHTTIVEDVRPLANGLANAIREAKGSMGK